MLVLPVPAPAWRARWSPAWKRSASAVCSSVGEGTGGSPWVGAGVAVTYSGLGLCPVVLLACAVREALVDVLVLEPRVEGFPLGAGEIGG